MIDSRIWVLLKDSNMGSVSFLVSGYAVALIGMTRVLEYFTIARQG
jgi:hypothetical protein